MGNTNIDRVQPATGRIRLQLDQTINPQPPKRTGTPPPGAASRAASLPANKKTNHTNRNTKNKDQQRLPRKIEASTSNAPRIANIEAAAGIAAYMIAGAMLAVGSRSAPIAAKQKALIRLPKTPITNRPVDNASSCLEAPEVVVNTTTKAGTVNAPNVVTIGAYPDAPRRAS